MPLTSVTGAEGLGKKASSRNKPQTQYETEKRYDHISYYDPVVGHHITAALTVTVNPGNTLWDIIDHQYGNLSSADMAEKIEEIKRINKLTDPNKLKVGQDLILPDPTLELGRKYIEKCRSTNKKPYFRSVHLERQSVLIRKARPEEMPDRPLIKSVNPELGTVTLNQSEPQQSYWVAKTEDPKTFESGAKKRREIYKNDLANLLGHGNGLGDGVGSVSGAVSRGSRQIFTVRPYLTKAGRLKYRVPLGKWGNINKKYPKGLPMTPKDFKVRYIKLNYSANMPINAIAAGIDLIFEGLDTGDWTLATYHGLKTFAEGLVVSLYAASLSAQAIAAITAVAAPAEAAAGPPGWVVLACGGVSIIISLGCAYLANWLDDEIFSKRIDPLIWGKERCMQ